MKYILSFVCILALCGVFVFCGLNKTEKVESEYLRIHIRANSNSSEDQEIKYMVRDVVVEGLTPYLENIETKEDAEKIIINNIDFIEKLANKVLEEKGFEYKSTAYLSNEYFPTRVYDDLTLESGYYDALILELGEGTGNNWWCVVYPSFCFSSSKNLSKDVYISKIWEIISAVKNGG